MGIVVNCPYYRWHKEFTIFCEGGNINMPTHRVKVDFLYNNCVEHWMDCCVQKALTKGYKYKY